MSLARVNVLNIGLMLGSLAVAMVVPFESFLLAYAVLGPLHYLTQISWLHDRGYFTRGNRDWLLLALLAAGIVGAMLLGSIGTGHRWMGHVAVSLMVFAFGYSLLLATTKDKALRWAGALVIGSLAVALYGTRGTAVLFGLYVPTIIHVCVFTAMFVLYGALKGRSVSAHLSALVFAGCVGAAVLWDPGTLGYTASQYAIEAYRDFGALHLQLMRDTGRLAEAVPATTTDSPIYPLAGYAELFTLPGGLQIGRLIAFAYTYHYLNWFSKTSVIRWHEVPRARMVAVVVIWIVSVALYAWEFSVGMKWLLFLSFLHVLLEFPLDFRTAFGVGGELLGRIGIRSRAAAG